MRYLTCLLLLAGVTAGAAEHALQHCVAIDDAAARLACYDAAAGRTPATASPPAATPAQPPAAAPVVRSEPLPPPRPPAAQPTTADADEFGLEHLKSAEVSTVTSRFDGEFTGWSGRTLFKLENGQVWRQAESGRFRASMDRPMITIERGAFNSYRLSVEGLNRTIRVKRIR